MHLKVDDSRNAWPLSTLSVAKFTREPTWDPDHRPASLVLASDQVHERYRRTRAMQRDAYAVSIDYGRGISTAFVDRYKVAQGGAPDGQNVLRH